MDEPLKEAWEYSQERKTDEVPVSFRAPIEVKEFIASEARSRQMERGEFLRLFFTSAMIKAKGLQKTRCLQQRSA